MHYIILYNESAANGRGLKNAEKLKETLKGEALTYKDITKTKDLRGFLKNLSPEDNIIVSGGDGTLNHFINGVSPEDIKDKKVFYHAAGSGNDFANDIGLKPNTLTPLYPYLLSLPTATVLGKEYKFINGVGFGIDGYCCEEGDRIRATSNKPINYTKIAILGLLFHFRSKNAIVTVDGVTKEYKNVWLAPTMLGRYYGGGMLPCPNQDRNDKEALLSTAVIHTRFALTLLAVFPTIFKGKHIKFKRFVEILKGREITVSFDKPSALQIDGETIKNVLSYSVRAASPLKTSIKELIKEA